jgi:sugar lactone lactonase YvrE
MGGSKNKVFSSDSFTWMGIAPSRVRWPKNFIKKLCVPLSVLLLSAGLFLTLSGCGASHESGFKKVGIYNAKNERTVYEFRENSTAERLASDLEKKNFDVSVREFKVKDRNNGKTLSVYEVYARPNQPPVGSIGWPKGSRPIVEYIGILQYAGNITWDGNPDEPDKGLAYRLFGDRHINANIPRHPCFMTSGQDGRIYVSSLKGIAIYDTAEKTIRALSSYVGHPYFGRPKDIAIGQDGKIYIADGISRSVLVVKDGKLISTIGSLQELNSPHGLALDEERGRLFVTDPTNHAIHAYSLEGKHLFSIESSSEESAVWPRFGAPVDVVVNSNGDIYFTDQGSARVLIFNKHGEYVGSFAKRGVRPGNLVMPKGIAVDSADNVYVVDAALENVQVFDSEGRLLLVFGSGGTGLGEFTVPHGIYIAKDDTIFVADTGLNRVQVFRFYKDRVKTMFAGGETP